MKKNILVSLAMLLLLTGCATQRVKQVKETRDSSEVTTYWGTALFNRSALEGLSVGKTTKTTAHVFALDRGGTETQPEAIKAMAEAIGIAAGAAAAAAVKP